MQDSFLSGSLKICENLGDGFGFHWNLEIINNHYSCSPLAAYRIPRLTNTFLGCREQRKRGTWLFRAVWNRKACFPCDHTGRRNMPHLPGAALCLPNQRAGSKAPCTLHDLPKQGFCWLRDMRRSGKTRPQDCSRSCSSPMWGLLPPLLYDTFKTRHGWVSCFQWVRA